MSIRELAKKAYDEHEAAQAKAHEEEVRRYEARRARARTAALALAENSNLRTWFPKADITLLWCDTEGEFAAVTVDTEPGLTWLVNGTSSAPGKAHLSVTLTGERHTGVGNWMAGSFSASDLPTLHYALQRLDARNTARAGSL